MRTTALALAVALLTAPLYAADAPQAAPPAGDSQKLIHDLINDAAKPAPPAPVVAPAPAPAAPAPAPVATNDDEARGAAALRAGQKPPVIAKSNVTRYPFGDSQPIVECAPLRACDIELQAGEAILGVAIGDSERWTTSPLNSGDPANLTPHVIVKPKDFSIATNLIISTTRRTYHLGLTSPSKDQASGSPYSQAVGFYYPSEMVEQWASADQLRQLAEQRRAAATSVTFASSADPSTFHYDYSVSTRSRVTWAPTLVLDDGAHTYIRFPSALRAADAPVLMAQIGDQASALNYRTSPDGLWYIADGLYDRLHLAVGTGRHQTTVDIERGKN